MMRVFDSTLGLPQVKEDNSNILSTDLKLLNVNRFRDGVREEEKEEEEEVEGEEELDGGRG